MREEALMLARMFIFYATAGRLIPLFRLFRRICERIWELCKLRHAARGMRILFISLPACEHRSRPKFAANGGIKMLHRIPGLRQDVAANRAEFLRQPGTRARLSRAELSEERELARAAARDRLIN